MNDDSQTPMADMLSVFDPTAPSSDPELRAALGADLAQLMAELIVADELAKKLAVDEAVNGAMTQKASGLYTLQ